MIGLINRSKRSQHPSRGLSKTPSKRDVRKEQQEAPPAVISRAGSGKCPNFGNVLKIGINLKRKINAKREAKETNKTDEDNVLIPGSEIPHDLVK